MLAKGRYHPFGISVFRNNMQLSWSVNFADDHVLSYSHPRTTKNSSHLDTNDERN